MMRDDFELKLDIARYRQNVPIIYSVVLPVYNEEESLEILLAELLSAFAQLEGRHEIIFVNDGSDDKSLKMLNEFERRLPEIIKIVDLNARQGQTNALKRGIQASRGEIVITLDSDLQNDPADIIKLVALLKKDKIDCACGWRKSRNDTFLKAALSKTGNFLQRIFTGLKIHDVSCTLRAYKRPCALRIPLNWEGQHRFIPLALSLQGFQVGEIVSNHRSRKYGHSKYGHKRIFKVMRDFFRILKAKGKK